MSPLIRTIGHSNHPIERFIELLKAGGVDLVIDVRSIPWSRRFPQFGRERLAATLGQAGIGYAHEGAALGGKPQGGGSYESLAARPDFQAALDRLIATAADKRDAGPDVKTLHAKIGQLTLENDFLAGALGRVSDASAKR